MGGIYQEHNYITSIYKTSNLNLVFSHYLMANTDEWRSLMTKPTEKENLSYSYGTSRSPSLLRSRLRRISGGHSGYRVNGKGRPPGTAFLLQIGRFAAYVQSVAIGFHIILLPEKAVI